MIRRAGSGHRFEAAVGLLVGAICLVAMFLLVVVVPDLSRPVGQLVTTEPTPSPSLATPLSPMAQSPVGIKMSADADCAACHEVTNGTVGTKAIPVMAHPLWGWRDCTACHSTGSLVATAPGHSGLHKDDCLVCHKPPDASSIATHAPLRPEHMGTTQPCTACHNESQHAPLPDSMKGRGDNCWICHNGPEFSYLFQDGTPSPSPDGTASPQPNTGRAPASAAPAPGS